jgi:hypothetical protein
VKSHRMKSEPACQPHRFSPVPFSPVLSLQPDAYLGPLLGMRPVHEADLTNYFAAASDHYREREPLTGSLFFQHPAHELQSSFMLDTWRQILRRAAVTEDLI